MKKTKDKSPLAILQSLLSTSIFLPERTTRNSLSTTLFITAYNLALVCCNCTFETHLKKEKLRKGPRSFIFPTVTCFISSFLIGSYQPASIRFLLSSLSTKNTYKCLSQWQRPAPHISCLPLGNNPDNPDIRYFYWQILLVVLDKSNSELATFVNTSSVRKGILSLPFHSCWLNWGKQTHHFSVKLIQLNPNCVLQY